MKLFTKTIVMAALLTLLSACGSNFEWFPTTNIAPVANAGTARSVAVNALVTLDGSASSDADGNTLTYSWSFTSKPSVSTATLLSATVVKPTFTADAVGVYILSLTVNDGLDNSAPATVTITVSPQANAGADQTGVIAGLTVTLDGSASSGGKGPPLTYSWAFISYPTKFAPTFARTDPAKPTFKVDIAGVYVISLVVYEGDIPSAPAKVTVTVINNTGSITVTW